MIAAREEVSLKRIENIIDPKYKKKNNLMLSGDISFSYPYDAQATKNLADEKFRKTINLMKGVKNWVLIFSRFEEFHHIYSPKSLVNINICYIERTTLVMGKVFGSEKGKFIFTL